MEFHSIWEWMKKQYNLVKYSDYTICQASSVCLSNHVKVCLHLPVGDAVDEGVDLDPGREFGGAGVVAVTRWMDDYDWRDDPDLVPSDDIRD